MLTNYFIACYYAIIDTKSNPNALSFNCLMSRMWQLLPFGQPGAYILSLILETQYLKNT